VNAPRAPSPVRRLGDCAVKGALLLVGLAAWATLARLAFLQPDPRGFGTHEQLGFAPCGFASRFGLACPGCGLTTSVASFLRGEVRASFRAHPMGPWVAVALAVFGARALSAVRTSRPVLAVLDSPLLRRLMVIAASVGLVNWLVRLA
jgi:hypothetical protein